MEKGFDVKGWRVQVIGMARSGIAAAEMLSRAGAVVTVSDQKSREQLGEIPAVLEASGIRVVTGGYPDIGSDTDLVVISPGVPLTVPPVQTAVREGIPLWSELELAYRFAVSPFLAVTGTNGKTTTTALLSTILQEAGRQAIAGGNIGVPLIGVVGQLTPQHLIVAEVSSFQLERIEQFRPLVAVLLNLTPDHLDRHGTFAEYIRAKIRVFENQTETDYAVLNWDDPEVRRLASGIRARVVYFSQTRKLESGVWLEGDAVIARWDGREQVVCDRRAIRIQGRHNLENAMAAVAAAFVLGVDAARIGKTLKSFPGVAHRLEFVDRIGGVDYINDSKGTNPDAAIKALDTFDRPVVLIAGGKDKGSDFAGFASKVGERAKAVVLLGQAAPRIRAALENAGVTRIHQVNSFREAVREASRLAEPGDVVLLSPACASWDMFNNFEERGDLFRELVLAMRG
jgi:UDP-N-acetylmuramoylalanine--D-glutamate ligase